MYSVHIVFRQHMRIQIKKTVMYTAAAAADLDFLRPQKWFDFDTPFRHLCTPMHPICEMPPKQLGSYKSTVSYK